MTEREMDRRLRRNSVDRPGSGAKNTPHRAGIGGANAVPYRIPLPKPDSASIVRPLSVSVPAPLSHRRFKRGGGPLRKRKRGRG